MTNYYYLVSSLPILKKDEKPFLSYGDFLKECERICSRDDFSLIQKANFEISVDDPACRRNDLLKHWAVYLNCYSNEMARFRALRAHKDPMGYLRGDKCVNPFLADAVSQAFKQTDPLKGELFLDETIWEFIECLSSYHQFDLETLIAYGLKLQILDRKQVFESSEGQKILDSYSGEVLEAINKGGDS